MAKKPVSQSRTMWVKKGTVVNGKKVAKGYVAQYGKPERKVSNRVRLTEGGTVTYKAGRKVAKKSAPSARGGGQMPGRRPSTTTSSASSKVTRPSPPKPKPEAPKVKQQGRITKKAVAKRTAATSAMAREKSGPSKPRPTSPNKRGAGITVKPGTSPNKRGGGMPGRSYAPATAGEAAYNKVTAWLSSINKADAEKRKNKPLPSEKWKGKR